MSFRKLLAAVLVASMVFGLVGTTAFAAGEEQLYQAAAELLTKFKIVTGDADGSGLHPERELTRAELVKIAVTAAGKGEDAKLLSGALAFSDTQKHWSSGYVALAKNMGLTVGYPDGTFKPDNKVTYAEVVAFLARLVGLQPAKAAWPMNYIQAAVDAGVIPAEIDVAKYASAPAIRGAVFVLANNAFLKVPVDGKNLYQRVFDSVPPSVTLDAVKSATEDTKVTVSGKVADAVALFVNGQQVAIGADGAFSADVDLTVGANTIVVKAVDNVGNEASSKVAIERVAGAVAKIEAAPVTVAAGGTANVAVKALDKNGVEIKDAAVEGTSTLGTFEKGVFTAGKVAGEGTLTLKVGAISADVKVTVTPGALAKVVADQTSVAPGTIVTLTAQDEFGNAITSGVTFSKDSANAMLDGNKFMAAVAGNYVITAKAGDVTKTVTVGVYGTTVAQYKVTSAESSLIANNANTTTLTLQALDANGNVIASNTDTVAVQSSSFEYKKSDGTYESLAAAKTFTLSGGVATLTVRTLVGELGGKVAQVVAYKSTGAATDSTATKAGITLVDQVATSVEVTNADTYLASDTTTRTSTFTVKVLDQAGKPMLGGYFAIDTSVSGPATIDQGDTSTTKKVYVNSAAGATVTVKPSYTGASGAVTLTATASGLATGSKAVTAALPGPAAKLAVTADANNAAAPVANQRDTLTFNVQVTDAAGVPVATAAPATVVVSFPDLTSDNWGEVLVGDGANAPAALTGTTKAITIASGQGSFKVKANKLTGALRFQVKDTASTGALTATDMTTVTFKGDVPAAVAITINGLANKATLDVPVANTELTVLGQLYDAAGNKTTYDGARIQLIGAASAGSGINGDVVINGVDNDETVAVDATGAATFKVSIKNGYIASAYTLTATGLYKASGASTDTSITAAPASNVRASTLTLRNQVAASVAVAMYSDAARTIPVSTVNANDPVYFRVTVNDINGRPVTNETLVISSKNADGTYTTLSPAVTNNANGTYDFTLNPQKAPAVTYQVKTSNSASPVAQDVAIGVRPATVVTNLVFSGETTQDLPTGQVKAFTISVADTYGNVITNSGAAAVSVTVKVAGTPLTAAGGKLAQIRTTADGLAVSSQNTTAGETTATLSIARGATGVTFYVVTNADAGSTLTLSASATGLTAPSNITLNVK